MKALAADMTTHARSGDSALAMVREEEVEGLTNDGQTQKVVNGYNE